MITYPLNLPPVKTARSVTLRAISTVSMSESPFTGEQQLYAHSREVWEADFALPPMRADDAEQWVSFLLALNGMEGTFLMGDPAYRSARGVATGTPLVNGAGQTGKTLATDGWTPNITGILKAGDYLQLGSGGSAHLHKLTKDGNSNGSGEATFEIWPRLRVSPADNAAIIVINPVGLWRLASNESQWSIEPGRIYGMSFSAMEAL